jgi:hypothetical protein
MKEAMTLLGAGSITDRLDASSLADTSNTSDTQKGNYIV